MYCGPLRVAKNEEVRVVFHVRPEGDGEEGGDATEAEAYPKDVVGKLSSVNSVEMRLVVEGEEALFKVMSPPRRLEVCTIYSIIPPGSPSGRSLMCVGAAGFRVG